MDKISASVGQGGNNDYNDVLMVQLLLHENLREIPAYTKKLLEIDGINGSETMGAIEWFQKNVEGMATPSRLVTNNGNTFKVLTGQEPGKGPCAPANGNAGGTTSTPKPKKRTVEDNVRDAIAKIKEVHFLTPNEESKWEVILTALYKKEFGFDDDVISEIGSIANIHKWLDFALDVVSILKSTGASFQAGGLVGAATSLSWSIGTALGFFGPFLQFVGFVRDLDKVMEIDCRIYEAIAVAFGVTYWAHGGIKPRQSQMFLDNWRTAPHQDRSPINDMQYHWNRGLDGAVKGLDNQIRDYSIKARMGWIEAERAMRATLRTVDKTTLTRAMLNAIEKKCRQKGEINKANSIASWMNKISYAK